MNIKYKLIAEMIEKITLKSINQYLIHQWIVCSDWDKFTSDLKKFFFFTRRVDFHYFD